MISNKDILHWKDLQNEVENILSRCGFEVLIEQDIATVRGKVEIDVQATEFVNGRKYSIICECKHWNSSIPQNIIHGLRTLVNDSGSNIAYIITTSKYQAGAYEKSQFSNVCLTTWEEFQEIFKESWYDNYFYNRLHKELSPMITHDYHYFDDYDLYSIEDKKLLVDLTNSLSDIGVIKSLFPAPYLKKEIPYEFPELPIISKVIYEDEYFGDIPISILKEVNFETLLEKLIEHGLPIIEAYTRLRMKYDKNTAHNSTH